MISKNKISPLISQIMAYVLPILIAIFSLSLVGKISGVRFLLQLIALFCGVWMVFYTSLLLSRRRDRWKILGKTVMITMVILLVILFILFIVVEWNIVSQQNGDELPENLEAVVVLGCGVNGTVPSEMLLYRLQVALKVLEEHPQAVAVLCGGQGQGEDISEAECMRRWLTAHGIGEDRIYLEEKSTSTKENLEFGLKVLREVEPQISEIAVITNNFHLFRSKRLCGEEGFVVYGVPAKMPLNPFIRINYYLREFASVFFMYGKEIFA